MQEPLRVPPSAPARVVVLASGTGSLLNALIDAAVGDYPARIVAVGVDRACRGAHQEMMSMNPDMGLRN